MYAPARRQGRYGLFPPESPKPSAVEKQKPGLASRSLSPWTSHLPALHDEVRYKAVQSSPTYHVGQGPRRWVGRSGFGNAVGKRTERVALAPRQ